MDDLLNSEAAPPPQEVGGGEAAPGAGEQQVPPYEEQGQQQDDFGDFGAAEPGSTEQQAPPPPYEEGDQVMEGAGGSGQMEGAGSGSGEVNQPLPGDDFCAAPPANAEGDGMIQPAPEENGAFLDGAAIPEPVAPPPEPENEDPRVQWRKKNQAELAKKDKEEIEARMAAKERGSEHLKQLREVREKRLSARKNENRANNHPRPEAGSAYEGSTWQKVDKLVGYHSGTHNKDVARMKRSLQSLKTVAA